MIVKNEEDTLGNLLSGVTGIFDEIIIVDTGSEDDTIEVAQKYTNKIYKYVWKDDFADARNFAFSLAECDYIMWLDADDVILPQDAKKLLSLKNKLDGVIREVAAPYNVGFDELRNVTLSYYRERIFLRAACFKWRGRIHETIAIESGCLYADFAVTHQKVHPTEKGRNLRIFEKMIEDGEVFDARSTFYYARELYYNNRPQDAEREFLVFLDKEDGFTENKIDACSILAGLAIQKNENPLPYYFKSFEYSTPRAEICCDIAKHFSKIGKFSEAIFWYNEALLKVPDAKSGAFVHMDCYGFIPYIELCVLYYALGDTQTAILMNEKAAEIKPFDSAVLNNREFFKSLDNVKK